MREPYDRHPGLQPSLATPSLVHCECCQHLPSTHPNIATLRTLATLPGDKYPTSNFAMLPVVLEIARPRGARRDRTLYADSPPLPEFGPKVPDLGALRKICLIQWRVKKMVFTSCVYTQNTQFFLGEPNNG